jgi:hypothetical protein
MREMLTSHDAGGKENLQLLIIANQGANTLQSPYYLPINNNKK